MPQSPTRVLPAATGLPGSFFGHQKARTVWIIGTQPAMPAVYGVKAPLYGALSTRNTSPFTHSRSVGRKCHLTPAPYSWESPNCPTTHELRPYAITFFGFRK